MITAQKFNYFRAKEGKVALISIRNSHIRLAGYGLLLVNVLIFLGTWCRWYIALPSIVLLLYGFYKLSKDLQIDDSTTIISRNILWLIIVLMTAWVMASGLGGIFPQKPDLHWRNAILHDLINYPWPVLYSDGSSLTYYIAFWLGPALLGKLGAIIFNAQAGWTIANLAYALYCSLCLYVIMLLLTDYLKLKSVGQVLCAAAVLVLFSGLDIVAIVYHQFGECTITIGNHLEWWTTVQYSSNSTQLSWVFNQAVPAWVATSLFLREKGMNHYAYLGLLLLPYGPFPFIGLFIIMVLTALAQAEECIREGKVVAMINNLITVPNIIAVSIILPVFYYYFFTNTAASAHGFRLQTTQISLLFIIIEFMTYAIVIGSAFYRERLFAFVVVGLLFIPLFAMGEQQDFCMRVSIPFLFLLMVYVLRYLYQNTEFRKDKKLVLNIPALLLLLCLGLGAVTPINEYRASWCQLKTAGGFGLAADGIGTLGDSERKRDNFVTLNAQDSIFYRYLAQ